MSTPPPPPAIPPSLEYDRAIGLVGLVSQEIYSRFGQMLTIHGFILAAIGVAATRGSDSLLAALLAVGLPIAGFSLCDPWRRFVQHGVKAQEFFRNKACELEQAHDTSVKLFTTLKTTDLIHESPSASPRSEFRGLAERVILLFKWIYGLMLVLFALNLAVYLIRYAASQPWRCLTTG